MYIETHYTLWWLSTFLTFHMLVSLFIYFLLSFSSILLLLFFSYSLYLLLVLSPLSLIPIIITDIIILFFMYTSILGGNRQKVVRKKNMQFQQFLYSGGRSSKPWMPKPFLYVMYAFAVITAPASLLAFCEQYE